MKKVLFPILALVLALGLAIPMAAAPVMAAISVTIDFESCTPGASVEGLGTVNTYLDIQTVGGNAVALKDGAAGTVTDPALYGAPNGSSSIKNGGLNDDMGFGDLNRVHHYIFTFSPGTSVSQFSITMFDYGDYNPSRATYHEVKLVAYDTSMVEVNDDVLSFNSSNATNPRSSSNPDYGDLYYSGDAVDASQGTEPGNWIFTVTGTGITKVELELVTGPDPNIGFDDIQFVVEEPSLEITKTGPDCAHHGDTIYYDITVTNDGDVDLTDVEVSDPMLSTDPLWEGDLAQGAGVTLDDVECTVPSECDDPCTIDPLENTVTATGWYESTEVSDTDTWSVDIFHPSIEVTKSGPEDGFFQEVDAQYTYKVTNTGDCSLTSVSVTDDPAGTATWDGIEEGTPNGLLDPDETWTYTASDTLICECQTITVFTNRATAEGTDSQDVTVSDTACWSVMVFQWQPRTIGYWGNWDNHYTPEQFAEIFAEVEENSLNLDAYLDAYLDGYSDDVNDFLLGKPPTFKDDPDGKARFLIEKQFLATWLNVKAYWDWTGIEPIVEFPGTADVGMDPNATVYLSSDAAELFGATPTVMDILDEIELEKDNWEADEFKTAQKVLDMMNNAENNNYEMFIYPEFDPGVCPMELRENPPSHGVPPATNPVGGSVWMYPDNENDELVLFVYLDGGVPGRTYAVFTEEYAGPTPTGTPKWTNPGDFTADSHGHGSYYDRIPVTDLKTTGPDYYLQIVLSYPWGHWGTQSFGTDIATITIP